MFTAQQVTFCQTGRGLEARKGELMNLVQRKKVEVKKIIEKKTKAQNKKWNKKKRKAVC